MLETCELLKSNKTRTFPCWCLVRNSNSSSRQSILRLMFFIVYLLVVITRPIFVSCQSDENITAIGSNFSNSEDLTTSYVILGDQLNFPLPSSSPPSNLSSPSSSSAAATTQSNPVNGHVTLFLDQIETESSSYNGSTRTSLSVPVNSTNLNETNEPTTSNTESVTTVKENLTTISSSTETVSSKSEPATTVATLTQSTTIPDLLNNQVDSNETQFLCNLTTGIAAKLSETDHKANKFFFLTILLLCVTSFLFTIIVALIMYIHRQKAKQRIVKIPNEGSVEFDTIKDGRFQQWQGAVNSGFDVSTNDLTGESRHSTRFLEGSVVPYSERYNDSKPSTDTFGHPFLHQHNTVDTRL